MTQIFYIILLSFHLILMGIAAMGPLVAVSWDIFNRNKVENLHRDLVRTLAYFSLLSLVVGILLGFTIHGFLKWNQTPQISSDHATVAHSSNILAKNVAEAIFGSTAIRFWSELGFSTVCLTAAVLLIHYENKWRKTGWLLQFLSGTNLAYHFPILFVTISQTSFASIGEAVPYSRTVYSEKLQSIELWATVIHNWGAMFIAAAICLLTIGLRINKARTKQLNQLDEVKLSFTPPITGGAAMILLGITWQLFSGTFTLLQMNDLRQNHFLGENANCTALLVAGVLTALSALPLLLDLSMNSHEISVKITRRKVLMIHVLLGCTWLFMAGAVILARTSPEAL